LASVAAERPGLTLVGGIDISPTLAGRTLDEVLGLGQTGVPISDDAEEVLNRCRPDIVLHATGSSLAQVVPQIEQAITRGASVISTCEELAWPFPRYPELSERLDQLARQHGVSVLGAGVNPGFVMDKLAITLMGACQEVRSIHIERIVNAARRREPLQRKVGAGLTRAQFEGLVTAGKVRHVGLTESAYMITHVLGLEDVVVTEEMGPVIAEQDMRTDYLEIHQGEVAGIEQIARVMVGHEEIAHLRLRMAVGVEERDHIVIDGVPPLDMTIAGGVHGDRATAALLVNSIPSILSAAPGLRTMVDIPLQYTPF
jgi:4-hydroxy-tetrahydrodipicolinate reductase